MLLNTCTVTTGAFSPPTFMLPRAGLTVIASHALVVGVGGGVEFDTTTSFNTSQIGDQDAV